MKLEAIDLNLLMVFEAMVAEEHVTRAAARIGLTQPAMSSALARLRRIVGDPLFERVNGRMQPTRRARELAGPIGDALARLRVALEAQPFRPEESAREFRIVGTDYVELVLLPRLLGELARIAPRVTVRSIAADALFEPPTALLRSGAADLAIGFYGPVSPRDLVMHKLFDERWVCVARKAQRMPRGRLDLRTFLATPHVRMFYAATSEGAGMTDKVLHARGLQRRTGATVAHMAAVPRAVAATGFLSVIAERFARAEAARHRLAIYTPPIVLPNTPCMLLWHERAQFDAPLLWLRDTIVRVCG
ncbi:MAG: LysR family transcriptional regulator [Acidobacteria bacterium]|nr:LysR family transcriptional regulator [Acidobacteriota bacterium]MBV9475678.1 LysR family transcriptional regulator [Acidobacteriota bacterium]